MQRVFVAENPPEAHLVAEALLAEGIEAVVENENLFLLRGDIPANESTLPAVMISREEELPAAREVVARYVAARDAARAARRDAPGCPRCGSAEFRPAGMGLPLLLFVVAVPSALLTVAGAILGAVHSSFETLVGAAATGMVAAFLLALAVSSWSSLRRMVKCADCGKEWKPEGPSEVRGSRFDVPGPTPGEEPRT
jgi:hypothetical protein